MKKDQTRNPDRPDLLTRNATIEVRSAEGDTPAVVRMSVSSDAPVMSTVCFQDRWMRAYEVLDHSPSSVDLSRATEGLVVLDRHYGDQIGLMAVELKAGKLTGSVRFGSGERAQEISKDAVAGIRRNVSVGYQVDPSSYRLEGDKDGVPVVRAMRWTPYEASFEPVPADTTVGVGRSAGKIEVRTKQEKTMDPKDIAAMYELAARHGIKAEDVSKMIGESKGIDALRALVIDKQGADAEALRKENEALRTRKPDQPAAAAVPPIGGDAQTQAQIVRKYSVLNVLRSALGITHDDHGNKVDCGFEREIDQACRAKGMGSKRGGQFIIPHAVLGNRAFTVAGTSSASVATNLDAANFIDLLRTKMVLGAAGVRYLTGLVGAVSVPKMTAGATGYWVSESGTITGSQPTLGSVPGTPHTCGVLTDISRRMLLQSTPDAEMLVRDEIVERIARTVQIAVFQGTGADGQPSAITAASGINNPSVTAGTPTYAELLGFPGSIMADNAEADGQSWIFTAEVWQKLAATFTDGTAKAERVLDFNSKTCLGYPYHVTEDVGANSAFFGSWASVMIGIWGAGIDLNMDTATLSNAGGLRIVGMQDVDVMVRLGEALAYNSAVTA